MLDSAAHSNKITGLVFKFFVNTFYHEVKVLKCSLMYVVHDTEKTLKRRNSLENFLRWLKI